MDNDHRFERSSDYFEKVQRLARVGSWVYHVASARFTASKEAQNIYGISGEDFSLEMIRSISVPEDRKSLQDEMRNLVSGASDTYDIEFSIKRPNDGRIAVIHSVADFDPEQNRVVGVLQDITESRRTEKALAESEQMYRSLFDHSVSGIVYSNLDGKIIEINKKMLELLGSPSIEETKKINLLTFPLLVSSGFSGDLRRTIETKDPVSNSMLYQSKWGSEHYLEYSLNPIRIDGNITGIMAKIEDITDRKAAEVKIETLLKEKDLILREVHHRIKNNMAWVESLLRLQGDEAANEGEKTALMDAAGRVGSLRVLYESLFESEEFRETSSAVYLSNLIGDITEVFYQSRDVDIRTHIDDFQLSPGKLFHLGIIINELVTNCMKYAFKNMSGEKIIEISVSRSKDETACLVVRDNGRGLPDGESGDSTGFGLMLIRMLAEQLGGNLEYRNDGGAVFTIEFML